MFKLTKKKEYHLSSFCYIEWVFIQYHIILDNILCYLLTLKTTGEDYQ